MAATANVKLTLFQGTPETDEGVTRDVIRVKVLPETYEGTDATNVRLSTTSAGASFFTKYQFQLVKTSDEDDFLSDLVLNVDNLLPNDSTGFFVNLPLVQGTLENGVVSLEDNTTYKVICTATVRGDPVVTQIGTAELTVTAQPKQRDNVNQGTLVLGNFSTSDDTLNFSLTNTKIVSQAPATVNGVEGLTYNANQALIDEIILTVYEVDTNGAKQNEATHTYSIDMSSKDDGTSKSAHFATQNGGSANDATGPLRAKGLTATSLVTGVAGKLATSADVTNGNAAVIGDFMADTSGSTVTKDVETYSFSFNEETQQILKKGTSDQYFDFDNNTYVFVKLTVVSGSFSTVFESTVGTEVIVNADSDPPIRYPTGSPAPIFITNIPNDCRLEVVQKTQKNGKNKLECKFIEPNPIAGANLTNLKLTLRVKMSNTATDRVSRTIEFGDAALTARRKTVTDIDTVIYTFTIATTDTLTEATPVVGGDTNSTNIQAPTTGDIILIGAGTTVDGNTTYSPFLIPGKQVFFAWEPSNDAGPNTSQNNIGTNQGQRLRELKYIEGRAGGTVQTITETTIKESDADINGIQVSARGLNQLGNISETSPHQLITLINEFADPSAPRPQDGVIGNNVIEKISEASFLEFAPVESEGDGNCEFTVSFNDSAASRSVLDDNDDFTSSRRLRQKVDIKSIRVDIAVEDIGNGNEAYAKSGDPGTLDTSKLTYYSNTFTIAQLTTIENARRTDAGGTGGNYLESKIMTTETNANVQFLSLTGATDISGGTISLAGYCDSANNDSATVTIAANTADALRDAIQSFNKVAGGAAVTIRANVIKIPGNATNLGGVTTDEYEIHLTLDATILAATATTSAEITYTQLASTALLSYTKAGSTTDATAETYTKYKFDLRNPTSTETNIFGFHRFSGTNKFYGLTVHRLASGNKLTWRRTHSSFNESLLIPDTSQTPFKLGSGNNVTVQFWVENEFGIVNTSGFDGNNYYKGIDTVSLPNLIPAESIVTVNEQVLADRIVNQVRFTIKDDQPRLTTSDSTLINMEKLEVVVKVTSGTTATTYTMVFEEDAASTDTVKLVDTRNATDGGAALFTVSQPGADNKTTFNFTLKNGLPVPGHSSADFSLQPNDIFEIVSTKMRNAYGDGVTTDKNSYVLDGGAVTKGFTRGTNQFFALRAEGVSDLTTGFKNDLAFDKTLIKADLLETIVGGIVTKDQNIVLRVANHSTVGANNNYSELITANGAQETITIAVYKADGTNLLTSGAKTIASRAAFNTAIDSNTSSALAAAGGLGPGDLISFAVSDGELADFQAQASPVVKAIVTLTTNHLNGDAITKTYTYTFSNKLQVTRPTITSISIPTSNVGTRELLTNPSSADITATVTLDVVSGGAVKATHGVPTKLVSKLKVVPNNKAALNTSKFQNPGGTNFTAAIAAAKANAMDPGQLFGVAASTFTGNRKVDDINTTLTWSSTGNSNDIPVTFSIPSELFGCELFVESHLEYEVSGGLTSTLNGVKTRTLINGDAKYNLTTSANTEYLEQFTTATGNTGRIGASAATLTSLLPAQSNLAMLVAPIELLPRLSGFAESSSAPGMPEFGVKGPGEAGVNFRPNGHVPSDALAVVMKNGNETMSFKSNLVHNDKNEYNTAMRAGLCDHVVIRTTDEFKLTVNGRTVNVTAGTTTYEQLIALETAALANGRRTNDIRANEEIVILVGGASPVGDGGNPAIVNITKSVNTADDRTTIDSAINAARTVTVHDILVFMFANEVSITKTNGDANPAGALLYNAIADQFGTNPVQDAPLIRTEGVIDKDVSAELSPDGALYLAATTAKHQASGNAVSIADVDNVTKFGVDAALTIADVSLTASDLVASSNLTLATSNS